MSAYHFIGIDPGLTGAVAVLDVDGRLVHVESMPTLRQGGVVGRYIDAVALSGALAPFKSACAFLEAVNSRPGQGVASMFSFGRSMGIAEGVCAALGMDTRLVRPEVWKKAMGLIGSGKDGSVRRVIDLGYGEIKDHNQAESVLLARFSFLNANRPCAELVFKKPKKKSPEKQGISGNDLGALIV